MWGTIISVASTALGMLAQKKQSDAQQEAAQFNVRAAEKEAEYQTWKNKVELQRLANFKNLLIARQTVMFAKAGVQLDSDTVENVMRDTIVQYRQDRDILKLQGQFNVERARTGAQIAKEEGDAARTAGYLSMGRTLLQGVSDVGEKAGWF